MRRVLVAGLVAGFAFIALAGCCTPCASTGWRFEVGRPAVFSSPGLVQQTSGGLALSPLGTTIPPILTGTTAAPGAVRLMGTAPVVEEAPPPRRQLAPTPSQECTCEMLLQILQRIDGRLQSMGAKKLAPGPEMEE